jgi:hypothetical protein
VLSAIPFISFLVSLFVLALLINPIENIKSNIPSSPEINDKGWAQLRRKLDEDDPWIGTSTDICYPVLPVLQPLPPPPPELILLNREPLAEPPAPLVLPSKPTRPKGLTKPWTNL